MADPGKVPDTDKTAMALKYPDFHTWRDLDAAKARGCWEDGSWIRLSDPEVRPSLDAMITEFVNDPEKARNFLQNLSLHKSSET